MKFPEQLVIDQLRASSRVAEVIDDRIYPVIAPASAPVPFAVWRRTGVQRDMTLGGPLGMPNVSIAIDIYAVTYAAARDIGDRFREVLDGWTGGMGDYIHVSLVSLNMESDGFIQLAGGELPPVYNVSQSWSILWQSE